MYTQDRLDRCCLYRRPLYPLRCGNGPTQQDADGQTDECSYREAAPPANQTTPRAAYRSAGSGTRDTTRRWSEPSAGGPGTLLILLSAFLHRMRSPSWCLHAPPTLAALCAAIGPATPLSY